MSGKGSRQRKSQVTPQQLADNWDKAFSGQPKTVKKAKKVK